jgi:hypothetical protein
MGAGSAKASEKVEGPFRGNNKSAGMNQHPPMHQLRMRPLKPWMNQKHILPCPKLLVFSASSLPQNISLLPTYLPPTYLP